MRFRVAHGDGVARTDTDRGDADRFSVEQDMTMADQLTRCNRRWRETGAESKIVEATFEQFEQLVAGRLLARLGFTEKATDLAFGNAIIEAQLLLFQSV